MNSTLLNERRLAVGGLAVAAAAAVLTAGGFAVGSLWLGSAEADLPGELGGRLGEARERASEAAAGVEERWQGLQASAADAVTGVQERAAAAREAAAEGVSAAGEQLAALREGAESAVPGGVGEATASAVAALRSAAGGGSGSAGGQPAFAAERALIARVAAPSLEQRWTYELQLGVFPSQNAAEQLVALLGESGLEARTVTVQTEDGKILQTVRTGAWSSMPEARAAVDELRGRYGVTGVLRHRRRPVVTETPD